MALDKTQRILRADALLRFGAVTPAQHAKMVAEIEAEASSGAASVASATATSRNQAPPVLRRRVDASDFHKAPYRFVPFDSAAIVYADEAAKEPMDQPKDGGLCAEIEIEWEAESPLLIGKVDDEGQQQKDVVPLKRKSADGPRSWVIPPTTLRGAIRSVAEILGGGRLAQVNASQEFGLRDFTHAAYANPTRSGRENGVYPIADPKSLKAGWLRLKPGSVPRKDDDALMLCTFEMQPAGAVRLVLIDDLIADRQVNERDASRFKKSTVEKKYQAAYLFESGAIAYRVPRLFRLVEQRNGFDLLRPDSKGQIEGHLVFSGPAPSADKKKYEYVHKPYVLDEAWQTLDAAIWQRFVRIHGQSTDDRVSPIGSWKPFADMFHKNQDMVVPIFYVGDPGIQDPGSFAFGLTRLFKVPHQHTLRDVLHASGAFLGVARGADGIGRYENPDFVEQLFGYVHEIDGEVPESLTRGGQKTEDVARKGRIAFGTAWVVEEDKDAIASSAIPTVMGPPRPSFAPFYLVGESRDYSANTIPKIAGRKRYPIRHLPGDFDKAKSSVMAKLGAQVEAVRSMSAKGEGPSDRVSSKLSFLVPGPSRRLRFRSQVRLFDVTPAELGLALAALTFDGDSNCRHALGRGKPFGAGQTKVTLTRVSVEFNAERSPQDLPDGDITQDGIGRYLACYRAHVANSLNAEARAAHATSVEALKKMSRPEVGARLDKDQKLDYLRLREMSRGQNRPENPYQRLRDATKPNKDGDLPANNQRVLTIP